jgi:site-specific recombinase XerD
MKFGGGKDRYILFPQGFRLVLKSYRNANPKNTYLFETRRYGAFTARRVQQIVQHYRGQAGLVGTPIFSAIRCSLT